MRPLMVEFTGTPEAGKTTVIGKLKVELESRGYKVSVVQESAELLPSEFPKGSWDAYLWMKYTTYANLLHSFYMPCDIILIDRGIIDTYFFGLKFLNANACTFEQFSKSFDTAFAYLNPDYVITLVSDADTSLVRRGGPGRVVNRKFLEEYNFVNSII